MFRPNSEQGPALGVLRDAIPLIEGRATAPLGQMFPEVLLRIHIRLED
jgi:hypothetical protein